MTALLRYPVKSMLGESVDASVVSDRGLAGDRILGLVHRATGKVASAKNPRQWRDLLRLRATLSGTAVTVTFPGGATLDGADPAIDAALSRFLGQPVTLAATPPGGARLDRAVPEEVLRAGIRAEVRVETGAIGGAAPDGTFFDFAPLHLLTTSTVAAIGAYSLRGVVEAERYRPNIVIGGAAPGFAENDWLGRELRIGPELTVRVIARSPRCAIPTLAHGHLARDTDALRVPAAHNRVRPADGWPAAQPCAGVYATVVRPGRIAAGDTARLT